MEFTKILSSLFYYLSLLLVGLIVGGLLGRAFVPKDAGLAGGAIVLWYIIFSVVGVLVIGALLAKKLPPEAFKTVFRIVSALGILAIGLIAYRFLTDVKPQIDKAKKEVQKKPLPTKPAAPATDIDAGRPASGIGMAKPLLFPDRPIYFFEKPNAPAPFDSLVFRKGKHFTEVAFAPAGFQPEYQKLDYDLFFLRAMSQQGSWLEVVLNKDSEKTAWARKDDVVMQPWAAFLPNIYAIEHLRPQDFPVRENPQDHASPLGVQPSGPWHAERVSGDWVKLKKSGWLRWSRDGKQLIRFVYLS